MDHKHHFILLFALLPWVSNQWPLDTHISMCMPLKPPGCRLGPLAQYGSEKSKHWTAREAVTYTSKMYMQATQRSSIFACIIAILSSVFFHRDPNLYQGFLSSEELPLFLVVQVCRGQIVYVLICVKISLFYLHLKLVFLLLINSFIGMKFTHFIFTLKRIQFSNF